MKRPFYRKFVIHSYNSVENITRKLEEETTGTIKFLFGDNKIFLGKVYKDGFKIDLSGYHPEGNCGRNSFAPVNIGQYRETEKGTDIIALFPMMLSVVGVIMLVAGFKSGAERDRKIIEKVLW